MNSPQAYNNTASNSVMLAGYLSLMETKKSLGVDEKSSKLAMSSCLTWMGSQSSMTNLESGGGGENAD